MAWTQTQLVTGTGTTSATATASPAPVDGHLLVAVVYSRVAHTACSMTAGGATWIAGPFLDYGTSTICVFYKYAASEGTSFVGNGTAATVTNIHLYEYEGDAVGGDHDIDALGTDSVSNVTTQVCGTSGTLGSSNDLCLAVSGTVANVTAQSFDNSYANGVNTARLATAALAGASGTTTSTCSWTGAARAGGLIVTFTPAVVTGLPPGLGPYVGMGQPVLDTGSGLRM